MNIRYIVELTEKERADLLALTSKGKCSARKQKRAQILLLSDQDEPDTRITEILSVGTSTVYRVKKAFVEEGIEQSLNERRRTGRPRKLDGKEEALVVATACSKPPAGRSRWTLKLLAQRIVVSTDHESLSPQTIMRRLSENKLKPWQKKMWCIPKFNAGFVAQMEAILDLYAEPPDPKRPVVNFDEGMKQLVEEARCPIPMKPGQSEKYDYEYRRGGVANIFLFFDRHRGWRHAKATTAKKAEDFAECMRELVDDHYPDAEVIRLVLDNFSTHSAASLYKVFSPQEARRILRQIEFHYPPPHSSWLNMVEIEIGVMNRQCLDRRIPNMEVLKQELKAWETQRNEESASIEWMFNLDKARAKLTRAYPETV